MFANLGSSIRPVLVLFAVLTVLTGTAYPFVVTGIGQLAFPQQAAGSLVGPRIDALRAADVGNTTGSTGPVPVDLVTASGSGLDPHISVAAAQYQAARVARLRSLPLAQAQALIDQHTEGRLFGFIGEPRVNVLRLNLALLR